VADGNGQLLLPNAIIIIIFQLWATMTPAEAAKFALPQSSSSSFLAPFPHAYQQHTSP